MMKTILQLYKLSAFRQVFKNRGMLEGKLSDYARAFVSGDLPPIHPYGQQVDIISEHEGGPSTGTIATAQVTLSLTAGG